MILQVSVIRTESDGQAKDIMEIMKDADAVLVRFLSYLALTMLLPR